MKYLKLIEIRDESYGTPYSRFHLDLTQTLSDALFINGYTLQQTVNGIRVVGHNGALTKTLFTAISPFFTKFAYFEKDGKFGYLDLHGNIYGDISENLLPLFQTYYLYSSNLFSRFIFNEFIREK